MVRYIEENFFLGGEIHGSKNERLTHGAYKDKGNHHMSAGKKELDEPPMGALERGKRKGKLRISPTE